MQRRSFFRMLGAALAGFLGTLWPFKGANALRRLPRLTTRLPTRLPAPFGAWRPLNPPESISADELYESSMPHFAGTLGLATEPRQRVAAFLEKHEPGDIKVWAKMIHPARAAKSTLTAVAASGQDDSDPEGFEWA